MLHPQTRRLFAYFLCLVLAFTTFAGTDNKSGKSDKPSEKSSAQAEDSEASGKTRAAKQHDPFFNPVKYVPPPKPVKIEKPKPPEPKPIAAPSIETRVDAYKNQLRQYLNGAGPEPSKISPYLIEELTITGVFRTEEGTGAFVVETATRNQQTYFAKTGWQTHDGYIKEILSNGVRFVKTVRYDNGTVKQVEEFRPLPSLTGK